MKQPADILKPLMAIAVTIMLGVMAPLASRAQGRAADSVEVSLLTCAPGNEIYSLYGHTALRYHDLRTGGDWTFNYGVFNFNRPFFVLRFVFGLTDYELGIMPYAAFREEYRRNGRWVVEQVINLTPEEKAKIYYALAENYRPENRTYRYNYFYDNCTTRARDMIEMCIGGTVEYAAADDTPQPTYRQMIHEKTKGYPWAEFGDDLCIGAKADMEADDRQQQFLPENLMRAFSEATITDGNGKRPLVKETRLAVDASLPATEGGFPLTPRQCAYILLLLSVAIAVVEARRRKTFMAWDIALFTCTSVAGIVVTALLFSEHPTTSTNLQALVLNPLPLFFLPSIAKRKPTFWRIFAVLATLFLIGAMFQDYADGMVIVALCLLIRCAANLAPACKQHKQRTDKA